MFEPGVPHRLLRPVASAAGAIGVFAAFAALALSACTALLPEPREEPAPAPVPIQWSRVADGATLPPQDPARWWRRFGDELLDALVTEALLANTDLASAQARLREAGARRALAASGQWPALGFSASVSTSRQGSGGSTREQLGTSLDASWELDLSGALRHAIAAADGDAAAAAESLRDVQLALVAELAREFVMLRGAQRRVALLESALGVREQSLQIALWRREAGLVSELDVAAARAELDSTRATLPALESTIEQSAQRVALLLGRAPAELLPRLSAGAAPVAPLITGVLAAGVPLEVLQRRPDVRAATRRVEAQRERLAAARAAAYPGLRLSAVFGLEAASLGSLADSQSLLRSLLAAASLPLADGARIAAGVQVQDALLEQSALALRSTVLGALREVEAALVAIERGHERRTRLAQAAVSASRTLALASQRYTSGLADYRSVLDAQRALLSVEDQLAQASAELAGAQIAWFAAVGGAAEAVAEFERPR